ncbi:hypothetical protein GCM10009527_083100 [Actinomadura nitritigenes]
MLSAGVGAGGELLDESFIMTAQASEDGDEGAVAGGGDHVGRVFAGREKTSTMIRATLVPSLRWGCSARRVFCMIFVWKLRVSAKQMASGSVCRWVQYFLVR